MRVLLHSGGPLGAEGRRIVGEFLASAPRVGFVTAANLHDERGYFERVRGMLAPPPPEGAGLELVHIRWNARPLPALAGVEAVFMGGGNTYALLMRLRRSGLLAAIRRRVRGGMPYVGASAGSNVAGPTILTTNDWNVVGLPRFDSLGLVGFNINPHYQEADPMMAAGSETRDDRIREYHVVNRNPVVGLEEGALVRVEGGVTTALGTARIKVFRRGAPPTWHSAGERLSLK
jgi:dipeptidase E